VAKRFLTIEAHYCKDWTIKDALREIIQNGLDTKTEVSFNRIGNRMEISDRGTGIVISDFLLGRSSKQGDATVIGQFGEGIKIACLVLARNHRGIHIDTKDKRYKFAFEYSDEWKAELLTIDELEASVSRGTVVSVEASDSELDEAKQLFAQFNPAESICNGKVANIINRPGHIYVNGLFVSKADCLFGYDFKGKKDLVNRDRNAINHSAVKNSIMEAIGGTTSEEVIRQILTLGSISGYHGQVEVQEYFTPAYPEIWTKVAKELWGEHFCVGGIDEPEWDLQAIEHNYMVISLSWGLKYTFSSIWKSAKTVVKGLVDSKKRIRVEDLEPEESINLATAKDIVKKTAEFLGIKNFPVYVFEDGLRKLGTKFFGQDGELVKDGDTFHVEVERGLLKSSMQRLVGIIMHECTHATAESAKDNSRDFENRLSLFIGDLACGMFPSQVKAKKNAEAALNRILGI
jgi:hypothetical protein